MTTIGIVGAGAVGQAIAIAVSAARFGDELVVTSRTFNQAAALAADVQDQCTALASHSRIRAGATSELYVCDAVIIAVRAPFHNTHIRDVRMGGICANAALIAELGRALSGYDGKVLVVTNPVDIMSRLLAEVSANRQVYGIGSALDSARYRAILAEYFTVPVTTVAGHVIGEHGDDAVVCASSTTIDGQPIDITLDSIFAQLHARPGMIRHGIGRVRAGAAGVTVSALHKILGLADGIEELSTAYEGGWLGVPIQFTNGQSTLAMPTLSPR
jgi:L-lactate dehydrogenase